jgi:hypothetical protein
MARASPSVGELISSMGETLASSNATKQPAVSIASEPFEAVGGAALQRAGRATSALMRSQKGVARNRWACGTPEQLIERYAARLVDDGLAQGVTLRSLRLVGDFMKWMASSRFSPTFSTGCGKRRFLPTW